MSVKVVKLSSNEDLVAETAKLLSAEWPELSKQSRETLIRKDIGSEKTHGSPLHLIAIYEESQTENNKNDSFSRKVVGHAKLSHGQRLSHGMASIVHDVVVNQTLRNQKIGSKLMLAIENVNK